MSRQDQSGPVAAPSPTLRELWSQVPARPPRRNARQAAWAARLLPYALFVPAGLVVLAVGVYPLLYTAHTSTQRFAGLQGTDVGLENFRILLHDSVFWDSLKTTCTFAGVAVTLELVIGLALAMALANLEGLAKLVRAVYLLPMIIAPIVVGITWRLLYGSQMGAVPYVADRLGVHDLGLLSKPSTALPALIAVDVWEWTPFMFLIALAGLQGLPSDPIEAAQVDGAGRWRIFWTVTLPMLRPLLMVGLLIRLIDCFTTFDQVFVLTRGGPGTSTQLLSIYSYNTAFKFSQLGYASAMIIAAVAFLLLVSAALVMAIRRDRRRLA